MGFSHDELGPARQPACSERGHYRRLASQRHAAPRNRRRAYQRNWLRTIPAGFITGSKRRIEETRSLYPSFDGLFCSRHSEGPSKKLRQLGHQIHNDWPADYGSDSSIRRPGRNSLEKDCDNPKTSTSKSCEENSQNRQDRLGIVMRMPSDLDSLPRNGAWKSFASRIVRKLPVSLSWRAFPTFSHLPTPDAELFKEYSVCDQGGLICMNVSKLPNKGELVMFNPLTGAKLVLPPPHHPRIPVLINISVDSATKSYKVVVAGSSSASDEHLSKKVEVFDSLTSKWKEVCDLPGPDFGLNEHQAGVCLKGKLFLISFLENGGRGVVAFDMAEETWLQDLTAPIPWSSYSNTLQLVESDGKLFLFSEQEQGTAVEHCIDELEFPNPEAGVLTCRWRNIVRSVKSGGRGLEVYPEHTCVGFGARKLCIFNTLNRDGVVYDMRDGEKCTFVGFAENLCMSYNRRFRETIQFALLLLCGAVMPHGARAEKQTVEITNSLWNSSNGWATAVTLLLGFTVIGAGVARGFFRRHRAADDRFDIMKGLEDSDIPRVANPVFTILPDIN